MYTQQNVTFTERMGRQVFKNYHFAAGTHTSQIAKKIQQPARRVEAALERRKQYLAEYEIAWI